MLAPVQAEGSSRPWVVSPIVAVLAPLLAVVASFADVALLHMSGSRAGGPGQMMELVTVPLSIGAGLWTFYLLTRLRREVLRRDKAEVALRASLAQRDRLLDREFAMRRELDHRVRNNLAGLVGLVGVYERSGRGPAHLAQAIRTKIEAMRGVHDIASRAGGGPLDLHSLLSLVADSIVPSPRRGALVLGGPQVAVDTSQASAMAMILQELCTNSLKHGALSGEGHVQVSWTKEPSTEGTHLRLTWLEENVPPPNPLKLVRDGSGVGLSLVRGFAQSDLRGGFEVSSTSGSWKGDLQAELVRPADARFGAGPSIEQSQEICA